MRQAVIPRHGAPDVFEMREAPDPVPGEGEIRICVRAAGINFADILARIGLYPDAPRPPVVVGYEVAGIVDAVGHGVANPYEGDRVVALTRFGGYSDCLVVPASQAYRFPDRLSDAEAAVPVTYLTAAIALYRMAALMSGETVLVHNAGGGLGIAATQLARRRATVIVPASAGKHDALRSFGLEPRPPVGGTAPAAAADGADDDRARGRSPGARGRADVSSRARGRRPPLHPEPLEPQTGV